MDLSGKYICIIDLFLYTESIFVGDVIIIKSEHVIKLDLPEGYHQHYIEGFYNSWVSDYDVAHHFKSLNVVRQEKLKRLLK